MTEEKVPKSRPINTCQHVIENAAQDLARNLTDNLLDYIQ